MATRQNLQNVANALQHLLPSKSSLPPSLSNKPGNLYQILSRNPASVAGRHVHQTRWSQKGIEGCYWKVTKAQFKCEGKHGKAWGQLYWRGKLISEREERIRGALKYEWADGISQYRRPGEDAFRQQIKS
ncbi:hypothetical protein PLICRDRAFT_48818 [Plicaturopsis crispa FD-325 SS-3]|nr:hypothetical protein PLICRDRAFT_48818 [Plicaturopsis crispa FD-325 SS-3]